MGTGLAAPSLASLQRELGMVCFFLMRELSFPPPLPTQKRRPYTVTLRFLVLTPYGVCPFRLSFSLSNGPTKNGSPDFLLGAPSPNFGHGLTNGPLDRRGPYARQGSFRGERGSLACPHVSGDPGKWGGLFPTSGAFFYCPLFFLWEHSSLLCWVVDWFMRLSLKTGKPLFSLGNPPFLPFC